MIGRPIYKCEFVEDRIRKAVEYPNPLLSIRRDDLNAAEAMPFAYARGL